MVLNTTGCDKRQQLTVQLTLKIDGEGRKSYGSICNPETSVTVSATISIGSSLKDPAAAPSEKAIIFKPKQTVLPLLVFEDYALKENKPRVNMWNIEFSHNSPWHFSNRGRKRKGAVKPLLQRAILCKQCTALRTSERKQWWFYFKTAFQTLRHFETSIRNSPFREAKFPWTWMVNIQHEFSPPRTLIGITSFSCQVQHILRFLPNIISTTSANRSAFLLARCAWHFCYQFF